MLWSLNRVLKATVRGARDSRVSLISGLSGTKQSRRRPGLADNIFIRSGYAPPGAHESLIWRDVCQPGSSIDTLWLVACGALAGRHGRKVQCDPLRDQTDIRGLILKPRCSSRLAV